MMRKEKDCLGEVEIPHSALYGIAAYRASMNFPPLKVFSLRWYKALGVTKKASYLTMVDLVRLLEQKKINHSFGFLNEDKMAAMIKAAEEVADGKHFEHFIVPALSGGAGTSLNMNINEIIANRALELCHLERGTYTEIDPLKHANIFQSTNDVVPTSLRIAAMKILKELEVEIALLRNQVEGLETAYRHTPRLAYTQLQEAIPSTWGRLFSTYSEALTRDWWRISKCWERIKVVNLGGGAIGSGLAIPRYYIFHVTNHLAKITDLPVVRAENLQDATANLDMWIEVHGMLKAHAANLIKMVSDLRLLSSDIHQRHELKIPAKQVGSSIMPGKINPVIPEYVISAAEKVFANDYLITHLCSQGQLDLNAYLPLIGESFLESCELLLASNQTIHKNLLSGLKIDPDLHSMMKSPSMAIATIPEIGYHQAEKLAYHMKENKSDIFASNKILALIDQEKLEHVLATQKLLELGYTFISED